MQKKRLLLIVLSALLVLTACGVPQGENPGQSAAALQAASTGFQGVEIQFMPNAPPNQIYDVNQLNAIVEVNNLGRFNLEPQNCFVELSGYDSTIITGMNYRQSCGLLDGKNPYNLNGGYNQIEFKSGNILLPANTPTYTPTLRLAACYQYQTVATPQVCVDPLFYTISSQQKSCNPGSVQMSSSQAAPVADTNIYPQMLGGKALFDITIQNVGGGLVLSPFTSLLSCPSNLGYQDENKVAYSVSMAGGTLISCKPESGVVTLNNGQGKMICQFSIGNSPSFETPLRIELNYNYMKSWLKSVQIVQTP